MPLTGEGRNQGAKALGEGAASTTHYAKYVSFGESKATITVEEVVGSSKKWKKSTIKTKALVVLTELNGKKTLGEAEFGFVVGVPYWVRELGSEEFALANTKAQAETSEAECIEHTGTIKNTTKLVEVVEATGAKTKRKATKFEAVKNGIATDSTSHEVEASGTITAAWAMY